MVRPCSKKRRLHLRVQWRAPVQRQRPQQPQRFVLLRLPPPQLRARPPFESLPGSPQPRRLARHDAPVICRFGAQLTIDTLLGVKRPRVEQSRSLRAAWLLDHAFYNDLLTGKIIGIEQARAMRCDAAKSR